MRRITPILSESAFAKTAIFVRTSGNMGDTVDQMDSFDNVTVSVGQTVLLFRADRCSAQLV